MNPIALAGPAVEPIPLAEMKAYLRLDGEDENDLVAALVAAARILVERQTGLALIRQSWTWALPAWPGDRRVRLPLRPVLAVEEVRISAEAGPPIVLSAGNHHLDLADDPARLVVAATVPEPAGRPALIEIDFACGFGDDAAAVPEPLRLALRRLVAFWFEHRGDEKAGQPGLPPDVQALLSPYLSPRLA